MDAAEFESVWLPLAGRFYRVAYYILESAGDAEDAVQDLYSRLWKLRGKLGSIVDPASYGVTIVRNICLDRLRSASKTRVVHSSEGIMDMNADPHVDIDREITGKEDLRLLRSCMARLPDKQRKILEMRVFENMSYQEIARRENLQEANIRVQVSNARKNLRRMMDNEKD
ncbi:MAG: RNA polymerase sigma factor [Bacteroidales bacterium]|nr:RNA polymerase sigma factor [Bacteroidales bacterium]